MIFYYLKLYIKFITTYLKTQIEYKFSFYSDLVANFLRIFIMYAGISIIFQKFDHINEWNYYEVLLLFSFNLAAVSICGMFVWPGLNALETLVQTGEFDQILLKPVNPLFHLLFRYFGHTFFGQIIICFILFPVCFSHLHIQLSLIKIVWFILIILSGSLIYSSLLIIIGSFSFRVVKSRGLILVILHYFYGIRNFANYPINIFNTAIQIIFTFILPIAFVNFIPIHYFLNKQMNFFLFPQMQFLTPLIAVLFYLLAYFTWNFNLRHYNSTGS